MAKLSKEDRKRFGLAEGPIGATRLLARAMDHDFGGKPAHAIICLNDVEGTFTAANVYGGNMGERYDPSAYTHPLPAAGDSKWKEWKKKGYEFVPVTGDNHFQLVVKNLNEVEDEDEGEGEDEGEDEGVKEEADEPANA